MHMKKMVEARWVELVRAGTRVPTARGRGRLLPPPVMTRQTGGSGSVVLRVRLKPHRDTSVLKAGPRERGGACQWARKGGNLYSNNKDNFKKKNQ